MSYLLLWRGGGGEMNRVEMRNKDGNNSGSEGIQNVKNLKKKKKSHHLIQFRTESHTLKQRVNINFILNIFGSNAKIVRFLPRLFRTHIPGNKSNNLADLKTLRKKEASTHYRQEIFFF